MRIFNLSGQNETIRNFKDFISQWKCNIWGKWQCKGSVSEKKKKRKIIFFSRIADYYFYFFKIIKNNYVESQKNNDKTVSNSSIMISRQITIQSYLAEL